jgi:hypothetical protein
MGFFAVVGIGATIGFCVHLWQQDKQTKAIKELTKATKASKRPSPPRKK